MRLAFTREPAVRPFRELIRRVNATSAWIMGAGAYLGDLAGYLELAVLPLEVLAGELGLIRAEGSTVGSVRVSLVGGAVADEGGHLDEGGLVSAGLGLSDCLADSIHIGVAILHMEHLHIESRTWRAWPPYTVRYTVE